MDPVVSASSSFIKAASQFRGHGKFGNQIADVLHDIGFSILIKDKVSICIDNKDSDCVYNTVLMMIETIGNSCGILEELRKIVKLSMRNCPISRSGGTKSSGSSKSGKRKLRTNSENVNPNHS